ncbi:MAG: peptidoglycan editing factor PgeF [Anaerolineales bacterium]|nr:peptidoglycan editing factor PgeF [Anaerolineales bacterium]
MPSQAAAGLRYFQFDLFKDAGVTQAVFTREGGVSQGPFAELNVGAMVGDQPEHVQENLLRCFAAAGRARASMFDSWLVHGTHVLVADAPRPADQERPLQADIIITDKPEVTLFMRYADCVPLLLVDPVRRAIGLAHAGWRGTLQRVAAKAAEAMQAHYGSQPGDLLAGIGPAISAARYEIGPEVVAEVRAAFGDLAEGLLPLYGEKTHFDLAAANQHVLQQAGVGRIEQSGLCTYENQADWFSHRGSGGKTGRFGALLALG